MAATHALRTGSKSPLQLIANWLALLVLLLLGVVWPPVFASELTHTFQPGGPLRFVATADFSAGAGNAPPRLSGPRGGASQR